MSRGASPEERELGENRSAELTARVERFVLRRTGETMAKFLPPLTSYVVFCTLTPIQVLQSFDLFQSYVKTFLDHTGDWTAVQI